MFKKRIKKTYPEGTFIPHRPRVFAILQLCFIFSSILYILSDPFMGQYFQIKSDLLLFDYCLGFQSEAHKELFDSLPDDLKSSLLSKYAFLKEISETSFLEKLRSAFDQLLFKSSSYDLAFMLLSIVIPICLLKKVEGARSSAFILPLIIFAKLLQNEWHLPEKKISQEIALYPKEEYLEKKYLNIPLSHLSVSQQQEELKRAWHFYLIEEILHENPAKDATIFKTQVFHAEYLFNVQRADRFTLSHLKEPIRNEKKPTGSIIISLIWNLIFAIGVSKQKHPQKNQQLQVN